MLVTARSGTVDDPAVAAAGAALTERLAAQPGVGDVWSYWSPGAPPTLAAEDRRHALVLAWVPGDADRVRGEVLPAIEADVIGPADTGAGVADGSVAVTRSSAWWRSRRAPTSSAPS